MRSFKFLFIALLFAGLPLTLFAAEGGHHGLTPDAPVHYLGPIPFTSSSIVTIVVAIFLIVIAQLATKNIQMVPSGLQNFVEWIVEGMYNFFGEILGADLVKKTFWFFCTIFIFILVTNWFGLLPGVGTIGLGTVDADGHWHISKPFIRGGNADLNMTLAMALVFFFLWTVWSLQSIGPGGMIKHLFSSGDKSKGLMPMFIAAIFVVVGVIEIVSIAFRPVSLSFRLYGNIHIRPNGTNFTNNFDHPFNLLNGARRFQRFIIFRPCGV